MLNKTDRIIKRPLIPAAFLAAGLSVLVINGLNYYILILMLLVVAVLCVVFIARRLVSCFVIFAVVLLMLINSLQLCGRISEITQTNDKIQISGLVTEADSESDYYCYKIITDEKCTELPHSIGVRLYSSYARLDVGDRVELLAYVRPVSEYKAALYSNGIYATGNISKVIAKEPTKCIEATMDKLRMSISAKLFMNMDYDEAAVVSALTIGDSKFQDDGFRSLVRKSGVSHIMVVSGMHMTVIIGLFYKYLSKYFIGRKGAAVITLVAALLFMLLCGFTMSVLRAGVTYFIMLFGIYITHKPDPLNSLCAAVCIISVLNPFALGSAGFVLSVMSTAGIVVLAKPMNEYIIKYLRLKNRMLLKISEALSVTLSALIFVTPFLIYYFGTVSLMAVFTNLLIGYAVTAALMLAAIALCLSFVPALEIFYKGLFWLCEQCTRYFSAVIVYFGNLPYAEIEVRPITAIICYLAIILIFVIIKYRNVILKAVKKLGSYVRVGIKRPY